MTTKSEYKEGFESYNTTRDMNQGDLGVITRGAYAGCVLLRISVGFVLIGYRDKHNCATDPDYPIGETWSDAVEYIVRPLRPDESITLSNA